MRTAKILGAGVIFAALNGHVSTAAEPDNFLLATTADLAALCSAPEDPAAIHMCQGFLVGAHRVFVSVGDALDRPLYCFPTDGSVTRDIATQRFVAWAKATPSASSMAPNDGLLEWARNAYPCKREEE